MTAGENEDPPALRYVTLRMRPAADPIHPVEAELAAEPDLVRAALHAVERLADGSIAILGEVRGDLARYREILAESPAIREFAIAGSDVGYAYSRGESTAATDRMLGYTERYRFVLEYPIEYTADGDQLVTMVGPEAAFVEALEDPPETVEVELESTGPYRPETATPFDGLTDRQREVLETAIERGYYENPRQATQADLAERLGLEPGTVGKHLRTVESKVFAAYRG